METVSLKCSVPFARIIFQGSGEMTQVQSPEFGQFTNTAAAAKGTQMPFVTSAESQTQINVCFFFLKMNCFLLNFLF